MKFKHWTLLRIEGEGRPLYPRLSGSISVTSRLMANEQFKRGCKAGQENANKMLQHIAQNLGVKNAKLKRQLAESGAEKGGSL